jgi:hypothetical protein
LNYATYRNRKNLIGQSLTLKQINEGKEMSEWASIISVLGTLGGTALGLIIGFWTSSKIESRKEKHEAEMEYRKELTKHMDDIIKPMYQLIEDLWGSLGVLRESILSKSSIINERIVEDSLIETRAAHKKLMDFLLVKGAQIDLLFPKPLSSWVFIPIDVRIDRILTQVSQGENSPSELIKVINSLLMYQKNLKRLIGYETKAKFEDIYLFPSKK